MIIFTPATCNHLPCSTVQNRKYSSVVVLEILCFAAFISISSYLLALVIVLGDVELVFAGSQDRFVEIEIELKLLEKCRSGSLHIKHPTSA